MKSKLEGFSARRLLSEDGARALLAEMEADAYAAIDTDALTDELHAATVKHVGERLADFMTRREILQNPGDIIKITKLRGRTTVDFATHIEIEAEVEEEWERDFAEELGDIGWDSVAPIAGTFGLITVEVEAGMDVKAPVIASVEGAVVAAVDLKVSGMTHDQDFFDDSDVKITSGSTEGSEVYIQGSAAVSAAVQAEIKGHASFKICFAGVCAGVAVETMIDSAAGADATATTTGGGTNGCLEWTMDTKHTIYAKYTDALKKQYDDAVAAAEGGVVVGGGAWLYVSMPYMKIYPVIGADSDAVCSLAVQNIFEFKPATSLRDDLLSAQKYEHPFGKYLIRTAMAQFTPVGPEANGEGKFPVSIPAYTSPASWDGTLEDVAASGRRRALLAAPVAAGGVACTDFNGGNATHFKGTVPASRATCRDSDNGERLVVDGAARKLCWSRDCCHGHAVEMSWARVVCVPGDVAKTI